MTPLLEARSLRVELVRDGARVEIVDGVDLRVEQGSSVGLAGESGCGKTMTLRSLIGLLPDGVELAGGEVRFEGRQVRPAELAGREVGMIFQEPMVALDPLMRVGDAIAEVRRAQGDGRREATRRTQELLAEVGVPEPERRRNQYPHELSGGLRQRVTIAMALAVEPRLLLCDEPTTALDVSVQAQILALLARLRRERGMAVVFVTHDIGVIAQTCDVVNVMYAGRVVEAGPTAEVLANPSHPYTARLLAAVPDLDPRPLVGLPGTPPQAGRFPSGCRFRPRCPVHSEDCEAAPYRLAPVAGGDRASACIHPHRSAAAVEARQL